MCTSTQKLSVPEVETHAFFLLPNTKFKSSQSAVKLRANHTLQKNLKRNTENEKKNVFKLLTEVILWLFSLLALQEWQVHLGQKSFILEVKKNNIRKKSRTQRILLHKGVFHKSKLVPLFNQFNIIILKALIVFLEGKVTHYVRFMIYLTFFVNTMKGSKEIPRKWQQLEAFSSCLTLA